MSWYDTVKIEELVGKTFTNVRQSGDEMIMEGPDGSYRFFHYQDCCEMVSIEDICGDLEDLENSPITRAEERSNCGNEEYGTFTWTYYELATIKGSVTVRWYGSSNGYYSESVSLEKIND